MKKQIYTLLFVLIAHFTIAQVAINSDGSAPDGSSMLEIEATDKGVLIPQVALTGSTDASTISSAANSLLIYNTATASDVTPGYYYWDASLTEWQRLITSNDSTIVTNLSLSIDTQAAVVNIGPYKLMVTMCDLLPDGGSGYPEAKAIADGQYCDTDSAQWAGGGTSSVSGALNLIDGNSNTSAIITRFGAGNYPAYYCDTLNYLGYSDWYLPAIHELIAVALDSRTFFRYTALEIAPGNAIYWSSTQGYSASTDAYGLLICNPDVPCVGQGFPQASEVSKTTYGLFRCVRKFTD